MDEFCWLCGKKGKVTKHHVLNKSWKPKKNLIIPLCDGCHRNLHHKQAIIVNKRIKKFKKKSTRRLNKKLNTYSIRLDNSDNSFRIYNSNNKWIIQKVNPIKNSSTHWVRFK